MTILRLPNALCSRVPCHSLAVLHHSLYMLTSLLLLFVSCVVLCNGAEVFVPSPPPSVPLGLEDF
jgi:hypothetical protein